MTLRLLALALLLAPAACFQPDLQCKPCGLNDFCPGGLKCQGGLCTAPTLTCPVPAVDAAVDLPPPDVPAPPDALDPDAAPSVVCEDRCCVGAECLVLPDRLRRSLVLWADRVSMPPPGGSVMRWLDRSGLGNDIRAHNLFSLPRVQRDTVGPIIEIDEPGHVLRTAAGPELQLGAKDFTVMVLARCDARTTVGTLFNKETGDRPRSAIELYCNHSAQEALPPGPLVRNRMFLKVTDDVALTGPAKGAVASQRTFEPGALHLVVARRTERNRLQLRVDGQLEAEVLIAADTNLYDQQPAFVGAPFSTLPGINTEFDGGLAAVILVRGPLLDAEVEALEAFVLRTMGPAATPF
jgi:hypothetical protein